MADKALSKDPSEIPQNTTEPPDPRRWWGLVVIALAQLIVVLDMTIVNISLPSAQKDLDISDGNRQWAVTAYTLAFGGLLLLGGRLSDLFGRKRSFIIGLAGFALASGLGGAAANQEMLFAARALQGVFGALLAPAALALLTTTFTDPKERGKAFGVFGAIAGAGAAIGMLAGGFLTEYLDWRWCLYVNIPIAAIGIAGAVVFLHDRARPAGARLDIPGAIIGTAGLVAIVYGFSQAESLGWSDSEVIALLAGGVALLGIFTFWQTRAKTPLLPLPILKDRQRGGAYVTMGLVSIGMFGVFLFLTYYLQGVLGYSPIRTGVSYLPMTVCMIIGSTQISARLLGKVAPRVLMVPGLLLAAGGLAMIANITVEPAYWSRVLPGIMMMGLGLGTTFMAAIATATSRVAPQDSGAASAPLNTAQQVGGSIGTALLNTLAASATTAYVTDHPITSKAQGAAIRAEATVHGFSVAAWWSTAAMVLAAIVAAIFINQPSPKTAHGAGAGDGDGPVEKPVGAAETPVHAG